MTVREREETRIAALYEVARAGARGLTTYEFAGRFFPGSRAPRPRLNAGAGAVLASLAADGLVSTFGRGKRARHVLTSAGADYLRAHEAQMARFASTWTTRTMP